MGYAEWIEEKEREKKMIDKALIERIAKDMGFVDDEYYTAVDKMLSTKLSRSGFGLHL